MPEVNMMAICLLVFFLAMRAIDAQNECPDKNAICINFRDCPIAIEILKRRRPLPAAEFLFLRDSQCGWDGNDPKVCCVNQCPDSNEVCINIRDCPLMVEILRRPKPLSAADLATLTNSQCGWDGKDPKVCCVNQMITAGIRNIIPEAKSPDPPDVTNHTNLRLLNYQSCGLITQQKVIIGGNRTGVFNYPWMALLAYDDGRGNTEFYCGGTVISERYVLTAAHCVTSWPRNLNLVGVRVGDHNLNTDSGCEKDNRGFEVQCEEKYQDFSVEDFHFHPEYTRKRQNDIALIRLNDSVDFSPLNVKPICLPFGSAAVLNTKIPIVTGWVLADSNVSRNVASKIILQRRVPVVSDERCKETYKRRRTIWHKQLCTSQNDVEICLAYRGGPLQALGLYKGSTIRIIQYGVASYGPTECGISDSPDVYTKVSYYMDWILNTMTD